ncbi:alcohol dehydrogenase [Caballeronia arationis]|nr:alcohol dehydrogenase [Caballeronia arationis]
MRAHSHRARLGDVNTVFADLKNDKVDCRMILTLDLAAFIAHASRMELLPLARSVNQ